MIFDDHHQLLSYNNWKKILAIKPRQSDYSLHVLFFPTQEDYFDGDTHHHASWQIDDVSLPQLQEPFCTEQHKFLYCHSEFLLAFDDESYCGVYQKLQENCTMECPTW